MKTHRYLVLKEVAAALSKIDDSKTARLISALRPRRPIYITGVGRSGLIVKAFGQRLMHLGCEVHLADEITAPAIRRGGTLIACSGTGTTQMTLYMARKARSVGARVISITATTRSPLAKTSNLLIHIPVPLEPRQERYDLISLQPARSLFEQTLFIYLDSVVLMLMDAWRIPLKGIERRHANLE